jgi:hypothetical protein
VSAIARDRKAAAPVYRSHVMKLAIALILSCPLTDAAAETLESTREVPLEQASAKDRGQAPAKAAPAPSAPAKPAVDPCRAGDPLSCSVALGKAGATPATFAAAKELCLADDLKAPAHWDRIATFAEAQAGLCEDLADLPGEAEPKALLQRACKLTDNAHRCFMLGLRLQDPKDPLHDPEAGKAMARRACELGQRSACDPAAPTTASSAAR